MGGLASGGYPRDRGGLESANSGGPSCQSLRTPPLDPWVPQQSLQALHPASLALCLQAVEDLEHQREILDTQWRQRVERPDYEGQRAFRQDDAVDPDNRLVARQMERGWEEALRKQVDLQEAFARVETTQPKRLTPTERAQLHQLSEDVPALWHAATTTLADRKRIVRLLIARVIVGIVGQTDQVQGTILGQGGAQTRGEIVRPGARLDQGRYYPALWQRLRELGEEGRTPVQIAAQVKAEGFRPPKRVPRYPGEALRSLRSRLGLVRPWRKTPPQELERRADEWLLSEVATHLDMPSVTLHHWIRRGVVQARQPEGAQGRWLIWADAAEVNRLQQRRRQRRTFLPPHQAAVQKVQTSPDALHPQERILSPLPRKYEEGQRAKGR